MNYKQKLIAWNSTIKYKKELEFLYLLFDNPQRGDLFLDFGCGVMTAINYFNQKSDAMFYGYDVQEYGEQSDYSLYDKELKKKYSTIYLNHSIAHIKNPVTCLTSLKDNLISGGKIIVITPNLDWLTFKNEGKEIKTDPTVIKHYSSLTLERLFVKNRYDIICQGQFGDCLNNQHERLWLIGK